MFRAISKKNNIQNNDQKSLQFTVYLTGVLEDERTYHAGEHLLKICGFNPYNLNNKIICETNLKGYPTVISINSFFETKCDYYYHTNNDSSDADYFKKNDICKTAKETKPDAIVYVIDRRIAMSETQIEKIKTLAALGVPLLLVGMHYSGKLAITKEELEKFAYKNNLSRPFFSILVHDYDNSEESDAETVFIRAAILALNRILYKRAVYLPYKFSSEPMPENVDETIAFRFEALKEATLRFLKEQIELSTDSDKKLNYNFFARSLNKTNNQLELDNLINQIKVFLEEKLSNFQGFFKENYFNNWKSYFQFKKIKSIANEIYPSILKRQNEEDQKNFIKGASIGFLGLFGMPKDASSQEFAKYLTLRDAFNLTLVSKKIAMTAGEYQSISMKK